MIYVLSGDIHLIDLQTRLPFKYGIATMTQAPHAFVRMRFDVDGQAETGVAADVLPPKWFKKDPDQPLDDEIDEMLRVIEHAVDEAIGLQAETPFDVWMQLDGAQSEWGVHENLPPLLSNFGTTLVERALLEAVCKRFGTSFGEAVRANTFGIRLGDIDQRLKGTVPAQWLPGQPLSRVIARHTIGMADPLSDAEISEQDRLHDGLPQSLEACVRQYGLHHFKIKLSGRPEQDIDRLQRTAELIHRHAPSDFAFTVDGNEQFRSLEAFEDYWRAVRGTKHLQPLFAHLMFVEQPFHRDVALDAQVLGGLREWDDRPKIIIDESDAERNSLSQALELGYHGTSHKNCKGVIRGIANACLLEKLRQDDPAASRGVQPPGSLAFVMSGEDLANIGPVALLQDLAVAASLGIQSIERNGHHYFAGLSAFPQAVQQQVLENHNDLYYLSPSGWPTLDIENGELDLRSVIAAPLGVGFELDVEQFIPADEWKQLHAKM